MVQDLNTAGLLFLRRVTRALSDHLASRLKEHLATLSPLLRPRRLLGDHIESGTPERVLDEDKNLAALTEIYSKAAGKPFDLSHILRTPLKPIGLALEFYPWEHLYEIKSVGRLKMVTITSPVRFVLSYSSGLSFSRLRQAVAGKEDCRKEDVAEFIVRCCIMQLMLGRYPQIADLFQDMRWKLDTVTSPDLGALPLTTLTAPIPTILPPDGFILESTEMSGTSQFEEIVDVDSLSSITDPLVQKANSIIETAKAGSGLESS